MANELKTRIQLRHDTDANWQLVKDTLVPLIGEACLTTDGPDSAAENGVNVNSDGTMTVNNINLSKITQTPGTELILNGGDATVSE